MRPGILLDRDGTINVDYQYVGHTERVRLIPGVSDAIGRFNRAGIPVAIVTNQSGVARGFYPEHNIDRVNEYITRELARHGAHIDAIFYSPNHPDGVIPKYSKHSDQHKPATGMAQDAAKQLDIDLQNSWVVGDRIEDVELARGIEASCVYLGNDPLPSWYSLADIYRFPSLASAASFIIEEITGVPDNTWPEHHYTDPRTFMVDYVDQLIIAFHTIDLDAISEVAKLLSSAYETSRRVFVAGNGGAAALADHFQCDHTKGVSADNHLAPVVHSLTSNTTLITAIANDIGYDAVFSAQLDLIAEPGDVLIVFSVSGNSGNILNVLQFAREHGIRTVAFTGFDGGQATMMADINVHVEGRNYGVVEDIFQSIMHMLAQYARQYRMSNDAIQSARF